MLPAQIASTILGPIDWQSDTLGFCHCPGQSAHTTRSGKKDCRITLDHVPTIHCFHSSCGAAVTAANRQLRRALWENSRPMQSPRRPPSHSSVLSHAPAPDTAERAILDRIKQRATAYRPRLFQKYRWPFDSIINDSPVPTLNFDPQQQFRSWLKLWPPGAHIWIGDVYSSGRPEHAANFRPVEAWNDIWPPPGNFTCGSAFKPGSCRRGNESLVLRRFLVVESDTLSKDEVGSVFAYLHQRLNYTLHAIIDTGGKSLHAWFDPPPDPLLESRLKAGLEAFGCDPKVFTWSQPVRVPGAMRDTKLQRLIWRR